MVPYPQYAKYPSLLFVDTMSRLIEDGKVEEAADLLYDWMHEALTAEDYVTIEFLCHSFRVSRLPISILRSILSLTYRDATKIQTRPYLYQKIYDRITAEKGPEYADMLIGQLK